MRRASPSGRLVFREIRLILLNVAADLSASALAAMRYFPPSSTDDVPAAPPRRLGVDTARVPIFIAPS